jgi:hypothetical protein
MFTARAISREIVNRFACLQVQGSKGVRGTATEGAELMGRARAAARDEPAVEIQKLGKQWRKKQTLSAQGQPVVRATDASRRPGGRRGRRRKASHRTTGQSASIGSSLSAGASLAAGDARAPPGRRRGYAAGPAKLPPLPTAAVSGGVRGVVPGRDRLPAAGHSRPPAQYAGADGRRSGDRPTGRRVRLRPQPDGAAGAAELPYDSLIVAAGAGHSYFGYDAWARHAPGLKTLEDALDPAAHPDRIRGR